MESKEVPRTSWRERRLHFVGIGGCGMSGLALVADSLGAAVTGSDSADGLFIPRLRQRHIPITIPHSVDAVPPDAEIIYSSAIHSANPERREGSRLRLSELHRGRFLAELASTRPCIAVAGTHGKTTTAAMIVHTMRSVGRRVGYIIGGDLMDTGTNADWGDEDEWLVVETDESDRSASYLHPDIAVVTNVDHDHLKTFQTPSEVAEFFAGFLGQASVRIVPTGESLIARSVGASTYDLKNLVLTSSGSSFSWRGISVTLPLLGIHNACNAAAALEVSSNAGLDPTEAAAAMKTFSGTRRRLQFIGTSQSGAKIYEDYAHHPTAIESTIAAARYIDHRTLTIIFEPWGTFRSRELASDFGRALSAADNVIILPHVGTIEEDVPGETTSLLVDRTLLIGSSDSVLSLPTYAEAKTYIGEHLSSGAVCLVLGCGPIHYLAQSLLKDH